MACVLDHNLLNMILTAMGGETRKLRKIQDTCVHQRTSTFISARLHENNRYPFECLELHSTEKLWRKGNTTRDKKDSSMSHKSCHPDSEIEEV